MVLHHVNFHTFRNEPVFEDACFDAMMRRCLAGVLAERAILCPAWELLPTHVHLIVADFADVPLSVVVKHLKGDTARAFFAAFPELRTDLGGGHLWRKGHYAATIVSHRQFVAKLEYVRRNRTKAGLPPPAPLLPMGQER